MISVDCAVKMMKMLQLGESVEFLIFYLNWKSRIFWDEDATLMFVVLVIHLAFYLIGIVPICCFAKIILLICQS